MYLVTGGAGFIGSNIVAALVNRGETVVVSDWLRTDGKWKNIATSAIHDLVFPEDLAAWLGQNRSALTAIIHMGAISATTERDADRLVANNFQLSVALWQTAAAAGVPYVYASSAATYGNGSEGFIDDQSLASLGRLRPLNAYGWSKHLTDQRLLSDLERGRPHPPQWAGLKFFNVYGPNETHKGDMRSVINKLYPKIVAGEQISLFKSHHPDFRDGEQLRDFVYVRDCVSVVLWLLANPGVSGLFNIGSGHARSFNDLVRALADAVEREPSISYADMPEELRDRYQYFTEADITKLRNAGYDAPMTSLEDGIVDYVKSFLR